MGQPSGTISFLFTDIEGSTAAWEAAPAEMASALARHDAILRAAIEDHQGYIFATGGDGFAVAFAAADDALAAAVAGQRTLRAETWPAEASLRVRMGIHSGTSIERGGDYFGPNVNRAARVMAVAHGGQIVASATTRALIEGSGLDGVSFEDAGVHRLKGLERPEPLAHVVVDGEGGFPPVRALQSDLNNLPVSRTSFVGREEELEMLDLMVAEQSLVTIVGPGGSGKTRLALTHASSTADCTDGVWFVDLSDLDRDDSVAEAVLTAVGLSADGLRREAVTAAADKLAGWKAIIVLDNCEQVINDAAEMAEELLARCPSVALVATSREPLAVEGEQLLRIAGLGAARADDSRLFIERMRLTDPGFQPSPANIATIANVCADLDHMPLAIELAAARASQLGMGDLVDGLLSGSPDRRQRRRHHRHRSLGEVVQWSLDLMTEPERTVFRRLSVFDGGFTLEAAQAVAGTDGVDVAAVADVVGSLVEQSMVDVQRLSHGLRYRLLATIRAKAHEELDAANETDTVRDRHLRWTADWTAARACGPATLVWFPSPVDLANQRVALGYAIDTDDFAVATELFSDCVLTFCLAGANDEAARIYQQLREKCATESGRTSVRLDVCDLMLAEIDGDFFRAHEIAEGIRSATDEDIVWYTATILMGHHLAAIDPPGARTLYDELDARFGPTPMSIYGRGEAAITEGRFDDAVDLILDAFDIKDVREIPPPSDDTDLDIAILTDLTVALDLADRADEAHIAIDTIAEAIDQSTNAYACMVPLLRAVVDSPLGVVDDLIAHLREAAELERQWPEPVMAYDCVAAGTMVATRLKRPGIAARAYAAIHGQAGRTVGTFAWRAIVRHQLRHALDDPTRQQLTELGKHDAPQTALDDLLTALSA